MVSNGIKCVKYYFSLKTSEKSVNIICDDGFSPSAQQFLSKTKLSPSMKSLFKLSWVI